MPLYRVYGVSDIRKFTKFLDTVGLTATYIGGNTINITEIIPIIMDDPVELSDDPPRTDLEFFKQQFINWESTTESEVVKVDQVLQEFYKTVFESRVKSVTNSIRVTILNSACDIQILLNDFLIKTVNGVIDTVDIPLDSTVFRNQKISIRAKNTNESISFFYSIGIQNVE